MKRSGSRSLSLVLIACGVVATVAFAADPQKPATKPASVTKTKKVTAGASDKALAAIDAQIASAKVDKKTANWKTHLTLPKVVTFDPNKKYLARMVTNKGTLVIELKPKVAPMHVTNFIYLARLGFYDGTKFHRVIKGVHGPGR